MRPDWLQDMPPAWKQVPFGSIFTQSKRKNTMLDRDFVLSVIKDRGVVPYTEKGNVGNKVSDDLSGYKLVDRGDFVLNSMNLYMGSVGVSDYDGVTSTAYIVCKPSQNVHAPFYNYLIQFKGFQEYVGFLGKGIMEIREAVRWTALKSVFVPVPDLDTQKAIADFLDHETARIDQLIEKKQRLVVLLGEQRSAAISSAVTVGLDETAELVSTSSHYLPQVPATWRVWRLKHLAEIRGGLTLGRQIPDDVEATLSPYMRVANVQAGWLDLSDVAEIPVTEIEKKRYRLKYGDVLMNEGGDNDKIGRGAVWKCEIASCVHQNHVFAVRPYDAQYSDWISLATNARYARDFFYLHSNQSTNLASISKTNLSRFPVALPPVDEMKATLRALWDRVRKLDSIGEKTKTSIDHLKEFRSALITAAVIGQIDVATWGKQGPTDRSLDEIEEAMQA